MLGGQWENNAASYGLPIVAVPSKNIPKVVERLTERYVADRISGETFKEFRGPLLLACQLFETSLTGNSAFFEIASDVI